MKKEDRVNKMVMNEFHRRKRFWKKMMKILHDQEAIEEIDQIITYKAYRRPDMDMITHLILDMVKKDEIFKFDDELI